MFIHHSVKCSSINCVNLYFNTNLIPVGAGYFCVGGIEPIRQIDLGLEPDAVGTSRISSRIEQRLCAFLVIVIGLLELFGPLCKIRCKKATDPILEEPAVRK